jgi:toxin ParE1/3/4
VGRFPLPWCHFERGDHLDVVRLLGERQDIPAILGDEFAYRAMLPR